MLPLNNLNKIAQTDLPLLVIHGEADRLLPVENGQRLYDASPSTAKQIMRIIGAGHNDLLFIAGQKYFNTLQKFIKRNCSNED